MQIQFSEHALLKQYIEKHPAITPVLVDVGAHIGTVTTDFVNKNWRVVAFEPEPGNHRRLLEAVGSNERVTVIQKAISDEASGHVDFYVSSEHYGIHSLQPFHSTHTETISVQTTRVDVVLDELNINAVGYLKIDIEGADFLALRSFDFENIKPGVIMVEFMDQRSIPNFGYSYKDMVNYMQQYGYKTWVSRWDEILSYGVDGEASDEHRFLGCEPYPVDNDPVWGNLIFIPNNDAKLFQSELQIYLATNLRHAKGMARRQLIENLPLGKQVYKVLRKLQNLINRWRK